MSHHRFTLEPYSRGSKHTCPGCKRKSFTQYIDTETNQYLNSNVGICDHILSCGYHFSPKQYLHDNVIPIDNRSSPQFTNIVITPRSASFIDYEIMASSLKCYRNNNLVSFLVTYWGEEKVSGSLRRYFVGTSKQWPGSTVFWLIDTKGKIRTGKIIHYNPDTGKRIKEPYPHINWVHKALNIKDFQLEQCFFGEHLLKDTTKPIAIVESEKTAIIASICLPNFTWLASGGLSNLSARKCNVLKDRKVIFFPDVNGFDLWNKKAIELSRLLPGTTFKVSDILEKNARETERVEGWDLADYLIQELKTNPKNDSELLQMENKNACLIDLVSLFDLVQEK